MAGPLKDRPWTEEEQAQNWAHSLAAKRPLLDGLVLSNLVILALVERIRRKKPKSPHNPKEAQFLKRNIKTVVAMERCCQIDAQLTPTLLPLQPPSALSINVDEFLRRRLKGEPLPPSELLKDVDELLALVRGIATAKVPTKTHDQHTLSAQRKWLTKYFKTRPVRHSCPPHEYEAWITEHREELYQGLVAHDCHCEYRDSLGGITRKQLQDCAGPSSMVAILLAELHQPYSPSAIQKFLFPRKK